MGIELSAEKEDKVFLRPLRVLRGAWEGRGKEGGVGSRMCA